jgi:hypothetical protein
LQFLDFSKAKLVSAPVTANVGTIIGLFKFAIDEKPVAV